MTQTTNKPDVTGLETPKGRVWLWANGAVSCQVAESTSIKYWSWGRNLLTVEFVQSPNKYYHYQGVPYSTVVELLNADSVGSFVARQIKPNYELL
jgi:hypothetical protein